MRTISVWIIIGTGNIPAVVAQTLSTVARISLITVDASTKELYSAFGHCGIRIEDPLQNIDILFNYGIFDHNQPNFYLNYTKGRMRYSLGIFHTKEYIAEIKKKGCYMYMQQLSLDSTQRLNIYHQLLKQYTYERQFDYNYLYNNCATKLRDLLTATLPGLQLYDGYVKTHKKTTTLRTLMNLPAPFFPWTTTSANILFSGSVDKPISAHDYMFLPKYLAMGVDKAQLPNGKAGMRALVTKRKVLLPDKQDHSVSIQWPFWFFFALLLGILLISYYDLKRGTRSHWVDVILLLTCGLMGTCMALLWGYTSHPSAWNYNLLWAWPTHMLASFLLISPCGRHLFSLYMQAYGIMMVMLLLLSTHLPQEIPSTIPLLWIIFLVRSLCYLQWRRKGTFFTNLLAKRHTSR